MEHAINHLRTADPHLALWIEQIGPCTLQPQPHGFVTLAYAIISQQISLAAARTIRNRLETALGELTPEAILAAEESTLRAAGLSTQKSAYLRDLAERIVSGRLELAHFPLLDDETIIGQLTAVKGIGRWTAEIYVMFALGRLDVLPAADLGLRDAARLVYELTRIPTPRELFTLGERWRPYRSVACWYLWQTRRAIRQS